MVISTSKGIHRAPSAGADGELDVCVNLMPKDGELRNAPRLKDTGVSLPGDVSLLAIHRLEGETNYIYSASESKTTVTINSAERTWSIGEALDGDERIVLNVLVAFRTIKSEFKTVIDLNSGASGNLNLPVSSVFEIEDISIDESQTNVPATISYAGTSRPRKIRRQGRQAVGSSVRHNSLRYQDADGENHTIRTLSNNIESVVVLGNTLIVTAGNTFYAIWRDGGYVWLGSEFPKVNMQFRLKGEYVSRYHTNILKIKKSDSTSEDSIEFNEVAQQGPLSGDGTAYQEITLNAALDTTKKYRLIFHYHSGQTGRMRIEGVVGQTVERIGWAMKYEHRYVGITFSPASAYTKIRVTYLISPEMYGGYECNYTLFVGQDANEVYFEDRDGDYGESGYNAVIGVANEFVNVYGREGDKFIYPFLVRYALRLYDGSYVGLSSPCLMVPNDGVAPLVWSPHDESGNGGQPEIYTEGVVSDLQYKLHTDSSFADWADIITDVVVGVTPPCYTYNQGAKFEPADVKVKIHRIKSDRGADVGLEDTGSFYGVMDAGGSEQSGRWDVDGLRSRIGANDTGLQFCLPKFDGDHVRKELTERGDFHIIKYIKADDVEDSQQFFTLELAKGTLTGLESRSVIDESSGLMSGYYGKALKVYNQRLVMGNVTERLNNGAQPSLLNGLVGARVNGTAVPQIELYAAVTDYSERGRSITLVRLDDSSTSILDWVPWFYFPSQKASSVTLYASHTPTVGDVDWFKAELTLEKHVALDGAFWFGDFESVEWVDCGDPTGTYMADTCEEVDNGGKVMQSKAANPFVFPIDLQNYVTKCDVIALATATKAMSLGQFGQFPLYAFCTDGVWALSFDTSGRLAASQPASLEMANNVHGICETDSMVVFTTDRGLRVLSGSDAQEIAAQMHGMVETSAHGSDSDMLEEQLDGWEGLLVQDTRHWGDILSGCRIGFDYPNNLLHIYPSKAPVLGAPDNDWHYGVDLSAGEVFVIRHNSPNDIVRDLTTDLVTLPETYTENGVAHKRTKIYDYQDTRDYSDLRKGFALTRPTAMGEPMAMKVLNDLRLVLKKRSDDESVRVAVLVSDDRLRWWRLGSLRHHSFKWFRFALFSDMTDSTRISGIFIDSAVRRAGKIR